MAEHRIMIIDDEKIVGDVIKLALEQDGHRVVTFLDARSALARLRQTAFDVVVTDYKMKGIDGMELLRLVKKEYPETPVIMITAFANLDVAIEALRNGVHDFFPKPVKIEELKASVRRALEKDGEQRPVYSRRISPRSIPKGFASAPQW